MMLPRFCWKRKLRIVQSYYRKSNVDVLSMYFWFIFLNRELERVSKEAAKAVNDLQLIRNSIVHERMSVSVTDLRNVLQGSDNDLRTSPILIPSTSPVKSKISSSRKSRNSSEKVSRDKSNDDPVFLEIDNVITQYKRCCSSMAQSVSLPQLVEMESSEDEFRLQHIDKKVSER